MKLTSSCFGDNQRIPVECAFCAPDPKAHVTLSKNLNPDLAWSDLPAGTRSLVLICHDRDVPSKADDVNQEGRSIPAGLPRIDFHHWVLVDIDPASGPIKKGEFSSAVTPKGKAARRLHGVRARASTTTPPGSAATRTWVETISGTTGRVRRGTIRSPTTTSLRSMRWTLCAARCKAASKGRTW